MTIWKFSLLCLNFNSAPPQLKLSKIPSKYKPKAIREAQQAVIDYLHSTRSSPYAYAEYISKISLVSVSNLITNVEFSVSNFSRSMQKFLCYHPINEFEFFYESIRIDYSEVLNFLPKNKFFLYKDRSILNAAYALATFGFP